MSRGNSRLTMIAFVSLLATATLAGGEPPDDTAGDLRAVFTRVEGSVTLTVPSAGGVRVARALQVIPGGATITVAAGGAAALVCSTHHQLLLDGRSEWSLTREACSEGRALSADTYRRLAPRGGRLRHDGPLFVVKRRSRGETTDPRIPTLVGPRNTAVLEGRPELRWTAVDGATGYQVELKGRGSFIERLSLDQVACAPDPGWGDATVCAAPYPPERPELTAGGTYSLAVSAEVGNALYKLPYGEPLRRLADATATEVEETVDDVQQLPLDEAARWALIAGIYLENELRANAIAAFRRALALEPAAELWISLGDAYLGTGLTGYAESSYRAAAEAGDEPGVEAAAAFGLGQCQLARDRYPKALELLERAQDLYAQLGLEEEAQAASQQAARARRRLRR